MKGKLYTREYDISANYSTPVIDDAQPGGGKDTDILDPEVEITIKEG